MTDEPEEAAGYTMVALEWRCATPSRTCSPLAVDRCGVHKRRANGVVSFTAAVNGNARHDCSARMLKTRGALTAGLRCAVPNRHRRFACTDGYGPQVVADSRRMGIPTAGVGFDPSRQGRGAANFAE